MFVNTKLRYKVEKEKYFILVPKVFCKAAKKASGNHGTDLTNHRGVITIPPIRNKGQILTLLKSYWCSTISQQTSITRGFLHIRKERLWNPG